MPSFRVAFSLNKEHLADAALLALCYCDNFSFYLKIVLTIFQLCEK